MPGRLAEDPVDARGVVDGGGATRPWRAASRGRGARGAAAATPVRDRGVRPCGPRRVSDSSESVAAPARRMASAVATASRARPLHRLRSAAAVRAAVRSSRAGVPPVPEAPSSARRCRCRPGRPARRSSPRRRCRPRRSRRPPAVRAPPGSRPAGAVISRRSTMRWRGVVVRSPLGQVGFAEAALDAAGRRPPRPSGWSSGRAGAPAGRGRAGRAVRARRRGSTSCLDPPHQLGCPRAPLAAPGTARCCGRWRARP